MRLSRDAVVVGDDLAEQWGELRATDPAAAADALDRLSITTGTQVTFGPREKSITDPATRSVSGSSRAVRVACHVGEQRVGVFRGDALVEHRQEHLLLLAEVQEEDRPQTVELSFEVLDHVMAERQRTKISGRGGQRFDTTDNLDVVGDHRGHSARRSHRSFDRRVQHSLLGTGVGH
jgi:hypothetical protein